MQKKQIKKSKKEKMINQYQYEFYIYRALRESIKKSQVYINNSLGYKSFEEETKISPNWNKEKDKILKDMVSQPTEPPHWLLSKPCMNLSTHTASIR